MQRNPTQPGSRIPPALVAISVALALLLIAVVIGLAIWLARTLDQRFPFVANTLLIAAPLMVVVFGGWGSEV
jgi:uncharacterized SAM-binding protein YcdF (DUF218 family)